MTPTTPARPVLRYHGGKWRLASWILGFFPPHRVYVEPYGGAASVLLQKPRCYAEVYNDLDEEIVNVFRVLRERRRAQQLRALLELTPFSRVEFEAAYRETRDPVERARRTIIKAFMGYGTNGIHNPRPAGMRTSVSLWRPPTAFRRDSNKSGTTPAHDWRSYPEQVPRFVERLRGVVIEQRPALEVIAQHDRASCLFYVDPPYVMATRTGCTNRSPGARKGYRHEMTDEDHGALLATLTQVVGMVVLSAYRHPLYEERLVGWERHDRASYADRARPRTESLYLNPAASRALAAARHQLEAL